MRCGTVQERLLLSLSGELDTRESNRILRHLEHCSACTAQAERLAESHEQLDAALNTKAVAPYTLEDRVMSAVRALPPPRKPWRLLLPLARAPLLLPAFGGTALLGLGLGLFIGMRFASSPTRPLAREAVRLDLTLLYAIHRHSPGLKPISRNTAEIASALTRRVGFSVMPVDLHQDGAGLVGAEKIVVQETPLALFRYAWQGRDRRRDSISLFQMDARKLVPPALSQTEQHAESYVAGKMADFNFVAWRSGSTNNVLMARSMPMHLLFQLACHACEHQAAKLHAL